MKDEHDNNPDESVRKDSSSGGIFNAIASAFIDNGGVVFGAAFDDDYSVRHVRIENEQQFKGLGLMWYKPDEPNKKTKVAEK